MLDMKKNIGVEGFEIYLVIKQVVFLQAYTYLNVNVVVPFHSVILFIYIELKQYIFLKLSLHCAFVGVLMFLELEKILLKTSEKFICYRDNLM